ncbi:MAG: SH3 domain-containing protein [Lachnospiraceae bacterium]|nr:SH3 domain-containing protein [Lachnospiraceae bacterium]
MAYNGSKESRRRRRRRRKILQAVLPVVIAIALIGIILLVAKSTGLFDDWGYSSKMADLNGYFKTISDDTASVVENGEVTDDKITVRDGKLYIPYEAVIEKYNENFYWEQTDDRLLYTTGDGVYAAKLQDNYYTLDGNGTQTGYQICYKNGETLMVCLDYVRIFTNFDYKLYGGGGEPYRACVKTEWGTDVVADVIEDDIAVRTVADKEGDILKKLRKGNTVIIVASENEKWVKVTTDDLITGYVETKHLGEKYDRPETPVTDVAPITVTTVADYAQPVILAWHNVTNENSAQYLKENEKFLPYINTISPTWFALADNEGTVESIASSSYVETCHAKGLKVWGLVSNLTYPEVSLGEILPYPEKRDYVTEQLLNYAAQYNLDGINIDFESVPSDVGPSYIQFIREFSLKAHAKNLVVSVDNYVPKEYSMHYNRKEQGIFADYVIIMGYDEHTAASEEAGSVASLDFVMEGIEKTLEEVPKEKIVNALPFYVRYWIVDDNENILDMQTLTMTKGLETVAAAGAVPEWNEASGQNYAEWKTPEGTNKIWLEDIKSIQAKLDVMKAHDIGGAAVWQLAFGTEEAFQIIDEYYK